MVVPCDLERYAIEKSNDYIQYTSSNIVSEIVIVGNLDCKRFSRGGTTGGVVSCTRYILLKIQYFCCVSNDVTSCSPNFRKM